MPQEFPKIRVVCPNCGKGLRVSDNPAFKNVEMKCPTCGVSNPFTSYKRVVDPPKPVKKEEDRTLINATTDKGDSGYFLDEKTNKKYIVPNGKKSLFGRMTFQSPSKADVPIDLRYREGQDMGVSRSHFYAESILSADGKYHVYISNATNVNKTFINGNELSAGESIGVKNGDVLSSSNMSLRFVQTVPSPSKPAKKEDDEEDGTDLTL